MKEGRAWGARHSVTAGEGSTGRSSSLGREEKRSGRRLQHLSARRPVARAKFVGQKHIENPKHLGRVAAYVKLVHGHMLDDVVWIDDERGPKRDPLFLIENAKRVRCGT